MLVASFLSRWSPFATFAILVALGIAAILALGAVGFIP
jgi:hypothetical protein